MLFGLGAKPLVGIDIGSSSVKLVEAEGKRNGWVVKRFAVAQLPEDTIVDGEVVNHGAIVEAIKTVVKESGTKAKLAATSVSGASVIIKHINIPITKPTELEDQVYWEAEQYIPFPMAEISLDFEVVREDNGDGKMDILLVAAKKDFIEKRLSTIRDAGLQPEVLDVDVFAIANVFWLNYDVPPDSSVVLVDVGASLTKINIVDARSSLFTRDVAVGGKNLTQEIQNKVGVGFSDAEAMKVDAAASGQIPDEVAEVFATVTENIAVEVRRSLDFYAASPTQLPIASIYICGGSSRIPNLLSILQEMLGLPVDYLNPFNRVEVADGAFSEELMAAISASAVVPMGLAIRGQEE